MILCANTIRHVHVCNIISEEKKTARKQSYKMAKMEQTRGVDHDANAMSIPKWWSWPVFFYKGHSCVPKASLDGCDQQLEAGEDAVGLSTQLRYHVRIECSVYHMVCNMI